MNTSSYKDKLITKSDFLSHFRRCSQRDTLDEMVECMENDPAMRDRISVLYGAADHRRVEIALGKLFDKIPKGAWKYI